MEMPLAATHCYATELKSLLSPTTGKYVSIFRIDGVAIIPPLMTAEKRLQMQLLKSKAIELEQKLLERRGGTPQLKKLSVKTTETSVITPCSLNCSPCSESVSQRSSELNEPNQQEIDDTYMLLSKLISKREEDEYVYNCNTGEQTEPLKTAPSAETVYSNSTERSAEFSLASRVRKLRKSETLIYDNLANKIIMPISDLDENDMLQMPIYEITNENGAELRDLEEKANLNHLIINPEKFSQIPSIFVNPPTPISGNRSFCDRPASPISSINSINYTLNDDIIMKKQKEKYHMCLENNNALMKEPTCHARKKIIDTPNKLEHLQNLTQKTIVIKPPQRSATSPSLNDITKKSPISLVVAEDALQSEASLLRSNSFTLEHPSKALIDHIIQQQANANKKQNTTPSSRAVRHTVESKAKRVQKVDAKMRQCKGTNRNRTSIHNHPNYTSPYATSSVQNTKAKRLQYDNKPPLKSKVLRNNKKSNTIIVKQMKPTTTSVVNSVSSLQSPLMNEIEADHRVKLMELIAQQREEQKRLQQAFEQQQKVLIEQLTAEMNNSHLHINYGRAEEVLTHNYGFSREPSPLPNGEYGDNQSKSPLVSPGNSIIHAAMNASANNIYELSSFNDSFGSSIPVTLLHSNQCSPHRLFTPEPPSTTGLAVLSSRTSSTKSISPAISGCKRQLDIEYDEYRRSIAATKINACARGFLVRRLFQTEHIQRIVQTIRDTLIFVINLHMETIDDPDEANTPANIKLKARLLQQLSSASHTLHLVFSQTTVKERMEIIARDRKRIKTKLLTMNMKRSSSKLMG